MQRLDEREEQGEKLLLSSVKSPYSKQTYKFYLRKYLSINGYQNASELLAKSTKEIEYEIRDFIISQKEKGMRYAAIYNYVKPVISMCKLSDKMINSKRIEKFMPPNVRTKKTTAYEHPHIAKLLEVADERMKVVILLCSSAGLRIGAIPGLNWGSLQEVGDIYQICVYEGEPEEYITFCSSETKKAILSYISVRERYNEVVLPSSPLVREQWDRNDLFAAAHPHRPRKDVLQHKLAELARAAGLRTKTQLTQEERDTHKGASKLKDIPQANGLRRFFSSQLVNSLQTEHRWLLEGRL